MLFAAIVSMYDAVMVRRSSGEQGAAIKSLIKNKRVILNSVGLQRTYAHRGLGRCNIRVIYGYFGVFVTK